MNLLKHLEDTISLYRESKLQQALQLESGMIAQLRRVATRPETKVVLDYLGQSYTTVEERIAQLTTAHSYLSEKLRRERHGYN